MPDSRRHRGAHPDDARLFARDQWPALQRGGAELGWLLDRGYALRSALALVGDRHALTQRERLALARSLCSAEQCARRQAHATPLERARDEEVWIDGYNLLITVESALGGGVILAARDGCYRDLASLHGTYREVSETLPALRLIGDALAAWGIARCRWWLDRPVSNSGRLRQLMLDVAAEARWPWDVALEFSPDAVLANAPAIVATSDSAVLDRCPRWLNAARLIIDQHVPQAEIVDLSGGSVAP